MKNMMFTYDFIIENPLKSLNVFSCNFAGLLHTPIEVFW